MSENRYTNTLSEMPAHIVSIVESDKHTFHHSEGFLLENGCMLLHTQKYRSGFYAGGNYDTDGKFHSNADFYEPVYDDERNVIAFRLIDNAIRKFSLMEIVLISQFALNTKANLMDDLTQFRKSEPLGEELDEIVRNTVLKLSSLSDDQCRQLMADVYWAFRERNIYFIQDHLVDFFSFEVGVCNEENN